MVFSDDGQIRFVRDWANDQRTSAPFFRHLEEALTQNGPADEIIVGLGPGSYTGSRIAISTAIGLAASSGASLFGLPSIIALAREPEFVVVGDAKRGAYWLARIFHQQLIEPLGLVSPEELTAQLRSINLPVYTSDELASFPQIAVRFPEVNLLLESARAHPQNLVRVPLAPIYLREPHITRKS